MKSATEMRALFAEMPEACDNTLLIAERVADANVVIEQGVNHMPQFSTPNGESEAEYVTALAWVGLSSRLSGNVPDEYTQRLQYELDVVVPKGFAGYFLIVADIIKWAKGQGIQIAPGRGSAAGSLLAWVLDITDIDPVRHGLMFERFLSPTRVDLPDIDTDLQSSRRPEVIQYVRDKYGNEHVAGIVNFSMLKGRSAISAAARAHGLPPQVSSKISSLVPEASSADDEPPTLAALLDPSSGMWEKGAPLR